PCDGFLSDRAACGFAIQTRSRKWRLFPSHPRCSNLAPIHHCAERPLMPLDWAPFVELVRRHERFLLTTHIRPDGDGLGSILALGEVLRQEGKQVRLVNSSAMPARYAFLDPDGRVEHFSPPGEEYRDAEVVLVMDTGTWNQLG